MNSFYKYALLAGSSLGAAFAAPAVAQSAAAQTTPEAPAGDEIIVTANKRAENVQDIPKSVQVIGSGALQRQNIVNIGELQKLVPTIAGEGQTLAIRGVGTGASSVNAPNKVGIVLDDIPQPSSTTLSNFLLDVERIEVLPGPQGTLAGRNATGGLVNMVTRGPSAEWTGFANLLYTSDQQKQAAFFLAGPVSDKIQISTSQYFDGFRGLTKNIYLDQWSNSYTYGSRNKVKLLLSDQFTVDVTAFYQYSHQNGDNQIAPFAYVPAGFNFPSDVYKRPFSQMQPGVTPSLSNRNYASLYNGESRTVDYGGILRLTFETAGGTTLTSINSYLNEDRKRDIDFGLGVIPLADLNVRPEFDGLVHSRLKVESYTSELRLNSADVGPLHYVAGLFFSNEKSENDFVRYLFPAVTNGQFDTKSYAAYAHADYDITEQLKLQGGIRFEKDEVGYRAKVPTLPATQKLTSDGVIRTFAASQVAATGKGSGGDSFLNYDIGAQYRVNRDLMFYGTFAKAKQGPIFDQSDTNGLLSAAGISTLPQESVKSFELGMKSQFFDRALTLNVSLFNSTYKNYQVQTSVVIDPNQPPQRKLASVGKVRTRGVEFSASARLMSNLRTDLNVAYTEAKILDFPNAPCYINAVRNTSACFVANPTAPTAAQYFTQGNLAGELLNRAPKWRGTLTLDYSVPVNGDGLEAFIAPLVKYASKQRTDLLRGPTSYLPDTTYVDVNVGVRNSNITAELFVRNLFKENEQTFIPQQSFSPNGALQRVIERINSRYIGGRVRYSF
ncbi:TonB-dependent receptor [Sphingobium sp. JS3065]|uniref:TonB-dependent receptor n=1 Tax=Sphingobium sp. JS3065 TaxID=2970925 RepID=UPI002264258E|nr:TonB-dependent receptor [Sphingobium sp. JS3065]UZW57398.1 TonB-dependent receptor [Sphingobium sp. JS3065]